MTDRPHCTGTTKKGQPCKAAPLKGTTNCLAHSDQETRESTRFGGAQPNAGRPPMPKPTEIMRRLLEQNAVAALRPYWRTLGFDVEIGPDGPRLVELADGGAKLYGTSKDGDVNVSRHDDLGAMMAAAEKLFDRVYGRPKQQTEITGDGGGPVEIVTPVTRPGQENLVALMTRVLPVPVLNGNGNGNGHHN